jgi:hypothetical protein
MSDGLREPDRSCCSRNKPVSDGVLLCTSNPLAKEIPMNIHRIRNIVPRPGRTKALAALAAVGLALAVAGPASAEPKQTPAPAKKGCEVQLKGPGAGQSIVYPDGHSFSVYAQSDRKTHTYTCNDGKWTETVSLTAGPAAWRNVAISEAGGALQAVRLR